jgi:hypothetical protein
VKLTTHLHLVALAKREGKEVAVETIKDWPLVLVITVCNIQQVGRHIARPEVRRWRSEIWACGYLRFYLLQCLPSSESKQ